MELKGKTVLIVGGAGFLGSHLVDEFLKQGANVHVFDACLSGSKDNLSSVLKEVEFNIGDINNYNRVEQAVKGVDLVVHTAFPMSLCGRSLAEQHLDTGIVGLYNCLRAAYQQGAFFVYASSISVYGIQEYIPVDESHPVHPVLFYGATKLAGEFYCQVMNQTYGLPLVILRYADLYGPRNGRKSAPEIFLLNCLDGEPIIVRGGGKQSRTYTYIGDAVRATILAVSTADAQGEIFNVAGSEWISIYDLANLVQDVTGKNPGIIVLEQEEDLRQYKIDCSKAKRLLNFKPQFSLEEGLKLTWNWLQDNYQSGFNWAEGGVKGDDCRYSPT